VPNLISTESVKAGARPDRASDDGYPDDSMCRRDFGDDDAPARHVAESPLASRLLARHPAPALGWVGGARRVVM
jgi:hypothetical protein